MLSNVLVFRLVVALVGVGVFLYGVREDLDAVRWVGVGFVAIAWILRFWRRSPSDHREVSPESE